MFSAGFHEEVTTALNHHAGMSDNIVVIRRQIYNLPTNKENPASLRFLDIDSDGETHQALLQKYRLLVTRLERIVSSEAILKWNPSLSEIEASQRGDETNYVKSLCSKAGEKLKAAVSRMVERQIKVDPYLAAGQCL